MEVLGEMEGRIRKGNKEGRRRKEEKEKRMRGKIGWEGFRNVIDRVKEGKAAGHDGI